MKLGEIIKVLEEIAPPRLAKPTDHVGLQVGDPAQDIRKVIVTVDVTPAVVAEAIRMSADLIVAHHPLIHDPLPSVRLDVYPQSLVYALVHAGTALYVMHTNFDAADGGITDALAEKLGVVDLRTADPSYAEKFFKLTTFVPVEALETVRDALAEAGAGAIGDYTHCSFAAQGQGTFRPMPGAQPYVGEVGELERVPEFRLEVMVLEERLHDTVSALLAAHPYDEVAYDVYPLHNQGKMWGLLKYGRLRTPMTFAGLCEMVRDVLEVDDVRSCGKPSSGVEKVALVGGGGGSRVSLAHSLGADTYVTGDVNHHQFLQAKALGLKVIDATHFWTERPGMVAVTPRLRDLLSPQGVVVEYVDDVTLAGE